MGGNISVENFLNLTLNQIWILLEPSKITENAERKRNKASINVQESIYFWRRKNVNPDSIEFRERYPTVEDKRRFYGIWPLS